MSVRLCELVSASLRSLQGNWMLASRMCCLCIIQLFRGSKSASVASSGTDSSVFEVWVGGASSSTQHSFVNTAPELSLSCVLPVLCLRLLVRTGAFRLPRRRYPLSS